MSSDADDVRPPGVRIGTAEREAAVAALNEHLQAGRLDSEEYVERVTAANTALTTDQLGPLFADLPAPHPPVLTSPGRPPRYEVTSRAADRSRVSPVAYRLVALAPIISVVLFFVVGSWLVFLLVPAAGILVYGADHRRRN